MSLTCCICGALPLSSACVSDPGRHVQGVDPQKWDRGPSFSSFESGYIHRALPLLGTCQDHYLGGANHARFPTPGRLSGESQLCTLVCHQLYELVERSGSLSDAAGLQAAPSAQANTFGSVRRSAGVVADLPVPCMRTGMDGLC